MAVSPSLYTGGVLQCRYRYRLRVTPTQARQLQAVFDTNRFVWNTALGRWSDLWRYEQVSYRASDMYRELTDWRSRFDWLSDQAVVPQQQVIRDLGRAIDQYFSKSTHHRRPKFKKKGARPTARWTTNGFRVENDRLTVAVAGGRVALRVVWSRPLPSVPTSVSIVRDPSGRWWANFVVKVEPEVLPASGETTGLDLGLITYATTECPDADVLNPRFARQAAKALARSKRNWARTQSGSNRREMARKRTARVHARVVDQRRDFSHKEARKLIRRFDRIGVERLHVGNMMRYPSLSRSISDAGWGRFITTLEWHAERVGRDVVRLNARNTTQTCSRCGTKAKSHVGPRQRVFECGECGLVIDRDRNAARNLNPGWAVPGDRVDGSKTEMSRDVSAA